MADDGQRESRPTMASSRAPSSMSVAQSSANNNATSPSASQQLPQQQQQQQYGPDPAPRRRPGLSRQSTLRDYVSMAAPLESASRNMESSTSQLRQARNPAMRRTVSVQKPYKGQEFSVDDAEDEVEEDQAVRFRHTKHASGTLRRQPSTLRRRVRVQTEGEEAEPELAAQTDTESVQGDVLDPEEEDVQEVEDEESLSDAESFTLKDRQQAINETHPFGIRIWKPALYKKNRSVQKTADEEIHSTPGLYVSHWLLFFNFLWTILFGIWLALLAAAGALVCSCLGLFSSPSADYGRILWGLSGYLLYPFGKYVKLLQEEAYAEEDEGEGRSISEYEQWQSGDIEEGRLFFGPTEANRSLVGRRRNSVDSADETQSLLGRGRGSGEPTEGRQRRRRLFGRGQWNLGRVVFFLVFYGLISPLLLLVSGICWFGVFTIPMGKVTLILFDHLRRHPLAMSFHNDSRSIRSPGASPSAILLCTYRAVGWRYWKYTIDGTNIFLINLLAIVAFVIIDFFVLDVYLGMKIGITNPGFVFTLALFSIIPLAYFIGQAVASISAQSSMGVGATINAFFSTVVEVFLYCVALNQGKAALVEGSIIGSIFAGVLFLPGLSMCFGALKRKTQRFNVKSAGATSTMLLFAVIAAFGPTLFYQIYGSHELNCHQCVDYQTDSIIRDCRRCYFSQTPALHGRFYQEAVRPYIWFAAVLLFLSYVIGLLFTLRTHAAVIWANELDEKKNERMDGSSHLSNSAILGHSNDTVHGHGTFMRTSNSGFSRDDIRQTQLYKRILGQSLRQAGLAPNGMETVSEEGSLPHVVPPESRDGERPESKGTGNSRLDTLAEEDYRELAMQVAEMSATAATVAARDAAKTPNKTSRLATTPVQKPRAVPEEDEFAAGDGHAAGGGHDAPNWSRTKSAVILLVATLAYAIIAEILVDTVDAVLENVDIDEKFLGITLFALVPNTTEFLNAISFAMNGNIALSMEIGSAYALQVCLLQIPALVLYSAVRINWAPLSDITSHSFTLIFPQWDMVTVILCVFLLSYMYGEGKSNYFKGSILILTYLVVVVGFYFAGFDNMDLMGVDQYDTLALGPGFSQSFKTAGRTHSGRAY